MFRWRTAFLVVSVAVLLLAICPEHGQKASFTGNRKLADRVWFCEYSHPLVAGGVHKFWRECD